MTGAPHDDRDRHCALPPLRVLVVDDDDINQLVMRRFLPSPPLLLDSATDGAGAFERALAFCPDLIFMDLEMPILSGIEVTLRLRAFEKTEGRSRCAIVALSAHDDEASRAASLSAGCDHYLVKPVTTEQIRRTLELVAVAMAGARPIEAHKDMAHGLRTARQASEVIDAGTADEMVRIDHELRDCLPAFLQSRREGILQMELAGASGDIAGLRQLAHRLAGSFSMYGFRWAGRQCRQIERAAGTADSLQLQQWLDALREHVASVRVEFNDPDGAA